MLHAAFVPVMMPQICRFMDAWNQNRRITPVLEEPGEAIASTTSISNNYSLLLVAIIRVHWPSLWDRKVCPQGALRLMTSSISLGEHQLECPCSQLWHHSCRWGQVANLAVSLSSRMFYWVIKLTSDNDKNITILTKHLVLHQHFFFFFFSFIFHNTDICIQKSQIQNIFKILATHLSLSIFVTQNCSINNILKFIFTDQKSHFLSCICGEQSTKSPGTILLSPCFSINIQLPICFPGRPVHRELKYNFHAVLR